MKARSGLRGCLPDLPDERQQVGLDLLRIGHAGWTARIRFQASVAPQLSVHRLGGTEFQEKSEGRTDRFRGNPRFVSWLLLLSNQPSDLPLKAGRANPPYLVDGFLSRKVSQNPIGWHTSQVASKHARAVRD